MGVMLTAQFRERPHPAGAGVCGHHLRRKRALWAYRTRLVSRMLIWLTVGIVTVLTAALLVMQCWHQPGGTLAGGADGRQVRSASLRC